MAEPVTPEGVEALRKELHAARAHAHALEARIKKLEDHAFGHDLTKDAPKVASAKSK